jgi:hypothetical protein
MIKTRMTGMDTTIKRLMTFQSRFRGAALRKAGMAGSKITLAAMKQNMPSRKKDYGTGGGTKKSLGRKVKVRDKGTRLWYGVGPRTQWTRSVTHQVRFWRDKQGRIRKAKSPWTENQQPSRKMHFVEKAHHPIRRTHVQTRRQAEQAVLAVLAAEMAKV